eukprot:1030971-Pleurochrysis_carterae.AAC.2
MGRACAVAQGGWLSERQRPSRTRIPRAWEAERERSASMHATRVQNGKQCMWVSNHNERRARRQAHWPGFTAVYADGGIHGISPASDLFGCIRSAAIFYVVPVATIMETMFDLGFDAISECKSLRPWFIWGSAPCIRSSTRNSRPYNCE